MIAPLFALALIADAPSKSPDEAPARILLMIAEQNVGKNEAQYWWKKGGFSTDLDAFENTFVTRGKAKGVVFVDRQTLQGKLQATGAIDSDPNDKTVKEFAGTTGAEVVIIGKALATDAGTVLGTTMHSLQVNASLRALNLDDGKIIATSVVQQTEANVDPSTGSMKAMQKAANKAADELIEKILAMPHAGNTVRLTLTHLKGWTALHDFEKSLSSRVKSFRQRDYKNGTAELEVELAGDGPKLAELLANDPFEIDSVTANTVVAHAKK